MSFLRVHWVVIIDVVAVAAVREVLDSEGTVIVPAVPAVVEVSHEEPRFQLETSGEQMAKNVEAGLDIQYYEITAVRGSTTLAPVTLRTGTRTQTTVETVVVEAGGVVVGSTEVRV